MRGEPIEAVNSGLATLAASMRKNPFALESVWISIVTFDISAKEVMPLTFIEDVDMPYIQTPDSGPTHLGQALQLLEARVLSERKKKSKDSRGDWAPFLFVMTDGRPSDVALFNEYVPKIKKLGFRTIIGCAAGPKAELSSLSALCEQVVSLSNMDIHGFANLFEWVSAVIAQDSQSSSLIKNSELPPPPKNLEIEV
jgi:uncharacterized protein YegL